MQIPFRFNKQFLFFICALSAQLSPVIGSELIPSSNNPLFKSYFDMAEIVEHSTDVSRLNAYLSIIDLCEDPLLKSKQIKYSEKGSFLSEREQASCMAAFNPKNLTANHVQLLEKSKNPHDLFNLARFYRSLSRHDDALLLYAELNSPEAEFEKTLVLHDLARDLVGKKKYAEAQAHLKECKSILAKFSGCTHPTFKQHFDKIQRDHSKISQYIDDWMAYLELKMEMEPVTTASDLQPHTVSIAQTTPNNQVAPIKQEDSISKSESTKLNKLHMQKRQENKPPKEKKDKKLSQSSAAPRPEHPDRMYEDLKRQLLEASTDQTRLKNIFSIVFDHISSNKMTSAQKINLLNVLTISLKPNTLTPDERKVFFRRLNPAFSTTTRKTPTATETFEKGKLLFLTGKILRNARLLEQSLEILQDVPQEDADVVRLNVRIEQILILQDDKRHSRDKILEQLITLQEKHPQHQQKLAHTILRFIEQNKKVLSKEIVLEYFKQPIDTRDSMLLQNLFSTSSLFPECSASSLHYGYMLLEQSTDEEKRDQIRNSMFDLLGHKIEIEGELNNNYNVPNDLEQFIQINLQLGTFYQLASFSQLYLPALTTVFKRTQDVNVKAAAGIRLCEMTNDHAARQEIVSQIRGLTLDNPNALEKVLFHIPDDMAKQLYMLRYLQIMEKSSKPIDHSIMERAINTFDRSSVIFNIFAYMAEHCQDYKKFLNEEFHAFFARYVRERKYVPHRLLQQTIDAFKKEFSKEELSFEEKKDIFNQIFSTYSTIGYDRLLNFKYGDNSSSVRDHNALAMRNLISLKNEAMSFYYANQNFVQDSSFYALCRLNSSCIEGSIDANVPLSSQEKSELYHFKEFVTTYQKRKNINPNLSECINELLGQFNELEKKSETTMKK